MSANQKLAWTVGSYVIALCVFVMCSAFALPMETTRPPTNMWDVFLNGKDLGIFAGLIVAFMVTIWRILAGESKRRERIATINSASLHEVTVAIQSQAAAMLAQRDAVASLSVSIGTGIHNVNEAQDRRLHSVIEAMKTRPCWMDGPIGDMLAKLARSGFLSGGHIEVSDIQTNKIHAAEIEAAQLKASELLLAAEVKAAELLKAADRKSTEDATR